MYRYLDQIRLQLWFTSPNVCATFLVMLLLLALGLLLWLPRRRWAYPVKAALWLTLALQLYALAETYSRGGIIGLLAALAYLWYLTRRRAVLLCGVLWGLVTLLHTAGVSRVASIGAVSDGSILHRFYIWYGGCGIIVRHWLSGVAQPTDIGEIYTAQYMPVHLNEQYRTLVNDELTIAALYGVPLLFLLLSAVLSLLYFAVKSSRRPWIVCPAGAVMGYFVCGFFSTMYEHSDVLYYLLFFVSWLLLALIVDGWQKRLQLSRRDWLVMPILALAYCLLISAVGLAVNYNLPVIRTVDKVTTVTGRSAASGPTAVYFYLSGEKGKAIRQIGRTLAPHRIKVMLYETDLGLTDLDRAVKFLQQIPEDFTVSGVGGPGRIALVAAIAAKSPHCRAVTVAGVEPEWPFEQLSPKDQLPLLQTPTRVYAVDPSIYQCWPILDCLQVIAMPPKTMLSTYIIAQSHEAAVKN